jgi:hypothetical protein
MSIDIMTPFPLVYLDWAKEVKGAKSVKDTERHDWVMEFGKLYTQAGGLLNGLDILIAKGATGTVREEEKNESSN